jgi:signal transduction histidine kinase
MSRLPALSLSVKVGLALFAVVAGALAIVYFAVVPQLESRLVDAKIEDLERATPRVRGAVAGSNPFQYQSVATFLGASVNARVVVFHRLSDTALAPVADSSGLRSEDVQRDPVASEAARSGLRTSGRVTRGGREFAEVATPVNETTVVLLSAPLGDALANVQLVRRSIVVAGLAALLVAWVAGYLAAWAFTRRIHRLEAAAERLAGGDFETPVVDGGRDEVGQLARAFDGMRLHLANLDRARREFIANASHELRTPLFSLGGFLELLADEELSEPVRRDFLAEMRGQIERLTRLATDLLDLSRLDAGQLEVENAPFDLGTSARLVAEEFRALAEADGRRLAAEAETPVPAVGDEVRVQQIGRALVENALRHTPGGTAVEVAAGQRDGRAYLAVRDEGPGIPAEDQAHLFERFYRAGGGKASGSGLGLAIASELAARMNGEIEVRSRPGETVFTLLLPAPAGAVSRENGRLHELV